MTTSHAHIPSSKLANHQRECSSLLQRCKNSVICLLRLVARVEQKRVTLGPPRIAVTNTPNGDTDTVVLSQAALDNVSPVRLLRILDVELSNRTLRGSSTESSKSSGHLRTLAGLQVGLRADAVDRDTGGAPGLYVLDHGLSLGIGCGVEVCVSLAKCRRFAKCSEAYCSR